MIVFANVFGPIVPSMAWEPSHGFDFRFFHLTYTILNQFLDQVLLDTSRRRRSMIEKVLICSPLF